jgi:hypothetical protein
LYFEKISFFREINQDFDNNSFKIILFALSNAKLPEKYRCMYTKYSFQFCEINIQLIQGFFRQITSPNVIASQVKLTELFEILLKVTDKRKIFYYELFLLFLVT